MRARAHVFPRRLHEPDIPWTHSSKHPIELPSDNLIGKHVLEGVGRRVDVDTERPEPDGDPGADSARTYASPGGADALLRP